jgi:hypothetical protein
MELVTRVMRELGEERPSGNSDNIEMVG